MALPQGLSRLVFAFISSVFLFLSTPGWAQSRGAETNIGHLSCKPCELKFSKVNVGESKLLTETLTNTGSSTLTISKMNDNAPSFDVGNLSLPVTLAVGQSVTFNVTFMPSDSGRTTGNIEFILTGADKSLSVYFFGVGVSDGLLTPNPWGIDFGSVQVNTTKTRTEALTNYSGSSVTISKATVTGTGFSITGLSLPLTLTPNQSYTFNVLFAPKAAGNVTGTLTLTSNAPNPSLALPLSGTGTAGGTLTVAPTTIAFGNVSVGSSKSQTGTLSASGATVTVSSATSSSSEFVLSGLSFPVTIASGQSTSFTVTFTPQASGGASGTITFVSNAGNSPTVESLTGTGTPPPQHSVGLTWDASNETDVVGYNVYRGNSAGGPFTKINSSLDPTNSYTDGTVVGGQTYYYYATAVDSNGLESTPSNQVKAIIPSP